MNWTDVLVIAPLLGTACALGASRLIISLSFVIDVIAGVGFTAVTSR